LSLKQRINRLRREVAPPEDEQPMVVFIIGSPESTRRLGRHLTRHEALVGSSGELFTAAPTETEKQFRIRMANIARASVKGLDRKLVVVSIGSDTVMAESIFNLDGSRRVLN
jgi:hypothetical protein